MIEIEAPAKLNLSLEILGRRADGYHNLASVMQTISLADTLTFEPLPGEEVVVESDSPELNADRKTNLVWRAARLLQQARAVRRGARISLTKRIPLSGGLGGGSSDAAAAIKGLDRLWDLNLQPSEMRNAAIMIGSDVPFFLTGGTALVEGRGEQVTPLRPLAPCWFVLVTPSFSLPDKTRTLYATLRSYEYSNGLITRRLVDAIAAGEAPDHTLLYNGFEDAAFRAFDGLHAVAEDIIAAGGEFVRLSGSGPTLYHLLPDEQSAEALAAKLRERGLPAVVAEPRQEISI